MSVARGVHKGGHAPPRIARGGAGPPPTPSPETAPERRIQNFFSTGRNILFYISEGAYLASCFESTWAYTPRLHTPLGGGRGVYAPCKPAHDKNRPLLNCYYYYYFRYKKGFLPPLYPSYLLYPWGRNWRGKGRFFSLPLI